MTTEELLDHIKFLNKDLVDITDPVSVLVLRTSTMSGKITGFEARIKGIIQDEGRLQLIIEEINN